MAFKNIMDDRKILNLENVLEQTMGQSIKYLTMTMTLTELSSPVGRHLCRAPSSPELSQFEIYSRTQSRTRQAASVAGEAVTIVEKPF